MSSKLRPLLSSIGIHGDVIGQRDAKLHAFEQDLHEYQKDFDTHYQNRLSTLFYDLKLIARADVSFHINDALVHHLLSSLGIYPPSQELSQAVRELLSLIPGSQARPVLQ